MISASSSILALTSSLNLNRILDRALREDCDHLSNAVAAARTASSTSRVFASSTWACCSPVAGFQTGE